MSATGKRVVLRMRDVCRTYSRGPEVVEALRGIDLDVEQGRIVAVVGASGSGKTTLLNIAGGVDRPTSGQVLVLDQRLDGGHERDLTAVRRRHVGMIFQDFCLMPDLTAIDNVRLPLMFTGDGRPDRALSLMERTGIGARRDFYPRQLSGGEQQRVAIARALINSPSLLLADEPTGNLDSDQAGQIVDLFRALAEGGLAILLATHDAVLARGADLTLHLRDGALSAG